MPSLSRFSVRFLAPVEVDLSVVAGSRLAALRLASLAVARCSRVRSRAFTLWSSAPVRPPYRFPLDSSRLRLQRFRFVPGRPLAAVDFRLGSRRQRPFSCLAVVRPISP